MLGDVCLTDYFSSESIFLNEAKWDEIRKLNSKGNTIQYNIYFAIYNNYI